MTTHLTRSQPLMGSDPEIFVRDSKGRLIDSHTALKEVPFKSPHFPHLGEDFCNYGGRPKGTIERDGTQAEIHPSPFQCIGYLCNSTFGILRGWDDQLRKEGYSLDFTQNVLLTEEDLSRFHPDCRQLGCQPSLNIYDPDSTLGIDAATYKWRSAGGHIHIGHNLNPIHHPLCKRLGDIVPLLDVLVGNTFVLIDRDPLAAQRREVYGRAGEYRLPSYGLEYRTLSNVWLRAFPLHSLAFELARLAFQVAVSSTDRPKVEGFKPDGTPIIGLTKPERNFAGELMSSVSVPDVIEAINSNNFDLALKNFNKIRGWIEEVLANGEETTSTGVAWPLTRKKLPDFDFFIKKGYQFFFGTDPAEWIREHWRKGSFRAGHLPDGAQVTTYASYAASNGYLDPGHSKTWNNFLLEVVRPQRLAQEELERTAGLVHQGVIIESQKGTNGREMSL